jgi:hypothetical protein
MRYAGYDFTVTGDEILFDEELNANTFLSTHGIEEDTLFYIENREGQLVLVVYYDDDNDGDPIYEEEITRKTNNHNILDFKYYARRHSFA